MAELRTVLHFIVPFALVVTAGQISRVHPLTAPAQITLVSPSQGPIAGGTEIVLRGAGFTGAIVRIDGQPAPSMAQSDTEIRFRMPSHDNGYATISVRTDTGTAYARYLYVPPRVDEIPTGSITTVAGIGDFKGDFGLALDAAVAPTNIVFDGAGSLYIAEPAYDAVSRVRTDGVIERFAGIGVAGQSNRRPCCGDNGPATDAFVSFPRGIAIDPRGNVYIADHGYRIRRVDAATGIITTIAGTGRNAFSGDGGPATQADIGMPLYVAADGTNVYFIDFGAARIRRIDGDGRMSTIAGNGVRGFSGDGGLATNASFNISDSDTGAITVDRDGNVLFADVENNRIRKVDHSSGIITTVVQATGSLNVGQIFALAVDSRGNIYYGGTHLVEVSPSGSFIRMWGSSTLGFTPDGTPNDQVLFNQIDGITFDSAGSIVYSEQGLRLVRRLNAATGKVETLAGNTPSTLGETGPAVAAALFAAANGDVVVRRSGDLLVADGRVRRLTRDGQLSTIAGHAVIQGLLIPDHTVAYDAPVGAWLLNLDASDEIDALTFGSPVYHIDSAGYARVLIGRNGPACGYTGDGGPAREATLCQPWGAARDTAGNLFIADTNNNRIRRVDAQTGIMSTFAGTGPVNGKENPGHGSYCGDGGPAKDACFNTPYSVAFDPDGNLFVSDWGNNRIRKIDRDGIITTFVQPKPNAPTGVFTIRFDRAGNLYTNLGDRIVRFDRAGRLTTIAGMAGQTGFSGDGGPALEARINLGPGQAAGIAFDDDGNIFFVDTANRRIRVVRGAAR